MNPADGSLILPRVNVEWGTLNLTSPTASGSTFEGLNLEGLGPLVFDVKMSMEDQGQTPTGSMKWNPAAPAYAIYEKCIEKFSEYSIMMTFYYVTGKSITFEFFWAGQSEVYGKEMEITVKLVSLMDGLINANFFATVQADKEEKGSKYKDVLTEQTKQFGLAGIPRFNDKNRPFIRYTKQADKDLSEALVKANYNDGATFMDAMQNLVKDNGNNVFFNNINVANAVVYGPYTYEGTVNDDDDQALPIIEFPDYSSNSPNPTVRYAHIIGPGIIQSFTRTMEWQPPQKSQEINAILARKKEDEKNRKKEEAAQKKGRRGKSATSTPTSSQATAGSNARGPSGIHGFKHTTNIRSQNNYIGPIKQDMFTKEKACKLSFTTLMCPSLVGIKPLDIVFIPSYDGQYLEDWIVSSVEYQQTQGGVDLAIQATRVYGSSEAMSSTSTERMKELIGVANLGGLTGVGGFISSGAGKAPTATLQSWMNYAWKLFMGIPPTNGNPQSAPSPVSTQAEVSNASVTQPPLPVRSSLPPELQADFDSISAHSPILPVDKVVSQSGASSLEVNDGLFYDWLENVFSAGNPLNLKFDVNNRTVTGLGGIEQAQTIYTNNFLPDRESYIIRYVKGSNEGGYRVVRP